MSPAFKQFYNIIGRATNILERGIDVRKGQILEESSAGFDLFEKIVRAIEFELGDEVERQAEVYDDVLMLCEVCVEMAHTFAEECRDDMKRRDKRRCSNPVDNVW